MKVTLPRFKGVWRRRARAARPPEGSVPKAQNAAQTSAGYTDAASPGNQASAPRSGSNVRSWMSDVQLPARSARPVTKPATGAQGVALVITLLMLAVITFMAVAFLVLSRTEAGSVTTLTDQTTARFAADAARDRAIADVLTAILTSTNQFKYGLMVSTNYFSINGFFPSGPGLTSATNVNYDYRSDGNPLQAADRLQNIANLMYNARVPVYVITNRLTGATEFRFYRDENRNGRFEPTGYTEITNSNGILVPGPAYASAGDPQWIGILEHPDAPHSATNRFVARVCYMLLPAGQTLDVNQMYNDARAINLRPTRPLPPGDEYLRNQGVGTYELNLSALLTDLNTNFWPAPDSGLANAYSYDPRPGVGMNKGAAFDDALSLLSYRYSYNRQMAVPTVAALWLAGFNAFRNDGVDGYSAGPVMTNTVWPLPGLVDDDTTKASVNCWAGSDNPNHFFTPQDFFDTNKTWQIAGTVSNLTSRLLAAGASTNSYDRYTFYRLLSQLGTDSAPEANKINLNYCNVDSQGNIVPDMATNFIPWTPVQFFTNVADRLLANEGFDRANINITNIQIWPTNFYTPSVHRLLQLAANIYDATTNRTYGGSTNGYPSVFRPLFSSRGTGTNLIISISGYEEVTDATQMGSAKVPAWVDLTMARDRNRKPNSHDMIEGIPLVVGAKKGWPNFNELGMQTRLQMIRKLQFVRNPGTTAITQTNQLYMLSISNIFGVEAWNSYKADCTRPLTMSIYVETKALLTNEFNQTLIGSGIGTAAVPYSNWFLNATNYTFWRGFQGWNSGQAQFSFFVPLQTNYWTLTNSEYSFPRGQFTSPPTGVFVQTNPRFPVPHWWLQLGTRVRYVLIDTGLTPNRIVDYVNLSEQDYPLDVTYALMGNSPGPASYSMSGGGTAEWITNRYSVTGQSGPLDQNTPTDGIANQMMVCLGQIPPAQVDWNDLQLESGFGFDSRQAAIDFFRIQFGLSPLSSTPGNYNTSNTFYAPYSPQGNININRSWQANDPLVHYTVPDLDFTVPPLSNTFATLPKIEVINFSGKSPMDDVGGRSALNPHCRPWGASWSPETSPSTVSDMTVKDPLVTMSDNWDFPTNKFPNIGWLGRVHRGTPWQTVFLKAPTNSLATWRQWSGDSQVIPNYDGKGHDSLDAFFSYPTNDWGILNLFTTAFDANTSRGQMSINQTNLAAWSAVLSGVNVLPDIMSNTNISPAGINQANSGLMAIFNGINRTRTNMPGGVFHQLGDILRVPEISTNSPFLSANANLRTDDVYERIPQQILGLLKCDQTPRFVIYAYGQSLKPADHSLVMSGPYFGLCTNYQVTAEAGTRAVVRIDGVGGMIDGAQARPRVVIESYNPLPPD